MFQNTLSGRLLFGLVKFANRTNMTVPVSVRFSLTQTLQGEQYQFIEATQYLPSVYPPSLHPESDKISKRRIEPRPSSHAVLRSHAVLNTD